MGKRDILVVVILCAGCTAAAPDAVHAHMEAAPPKKILPHVRTAVKSSALGGPLGILPPNLILGLLALGSCFLLNPAAASSLTLHAICFIGSLVEPLESLLPKRSILRAFIYQVKKSRRAFEVKHGIPSDMDDDDGPAFLDEPPEEGAEVSEMEGLEPAAVSEEGEGSERAEGTHLSAAPVEESDSVEEV